MHETEAPDEAVILEGHIVVMEGDIWVAHSLAGLTGARTETTCPHCGGRLVEDDEPQEEPLLYDTLLGAITARQAPGQRVPLLVGPE